MRREFQWCAVLGAVLLVTGCGGGNGGGPTPPSNRAPSANLSATPTEGTAPLEVARHVTGQLPGLESPQDGISLPIDRNKGASKPLTAP